MLEELVEHATIDRYPPGRHIFRERDIDNRTVFLLSGQLALMANGQPAVTVKSDTSEACYPIAQHQPRLVSALARTSVTVLSVDTGFLSQLIRRNAPVASADSNNEVHEEESDPRINSLLKRPLFEHLPYAHRQVLMRRMVEVPVAAGEVVIREGEESENYYLIAEGCCRLSRSVGGDSGQEIIMGDLDPGHGFDEGALIENEPNEWTVTMLEDGLLLKLSKGEFLTLLVRPFIKWVGCDEALLRQTDGAVLLDVRTPAAFQRNNLPGSLNMPLIVLRRAVTIIDRTRSYIVCCDVGRRSATAAFLLAQRGIDTAILEGGLRKSLRK
ncbi:MAG: cyclic nucleotide-binding domain-containing protein [Gammaproteobacteria bacterium]|nr:cyclic nucleotide-binding domain-containing protein [Gammaproteobacteria bacterium]